MPRVKKGELTIPELLELSKNGNIEARDKLILHFMPKAEQIASEYFGLGIENEDIIASAYEGLVKGITNCLKTKKAQIQRYVNYYIIQTITNSFITYYGVSLANYYGRKIVSVLIIKRELIKVLHRPPSLEEISEKANMSLEDTKKVLDIISRRKNINFEDMTLIEQSQIKNAVVNPEFNLFNNSKIFLDNMLLLNIQKEIIRLRYLDENPKNFEEIARILNRNITAIYHHHNRALFEIREYQNFENFFQTLNDLDPRKSIEEEIQYQKRINRPKKSLKNENINTIPELLELHKNGDYRATEKLYRYFLPRAKEIASNFIDLEIDKIELIESACSGLVQGLEKLKEESYNNFLDVINRNIIMAITKDLLNYYNFKIQHELTKKLSRKPTLEEITEEINPFKNQILKIIENLKETLTFDAHSLLDDVKKRNYSLKK